MHDHRVVVVGDDGKPETVVEVAGQPSGLGWLPDGSMIIASMRNQRLLKFNDGELTEHADLTDVGVGYLNDMVVDGRGNTYVGHRRGRYATPPEINEEWLVLVRPDGTHQVVADDVVSPNGSVVTPDGKTLIVGESRALRLSAWHIEDDGTLSGRWTFAQLEQEIPDGICLDAEGGVWVAGLRTTFSRVMDGGEIVETIEIKDGQPIACALGGADRRTLFMIITDVDPAHVRSLQSPEDDARSESVGRVEIAQVEVAGAGWP
jgi:sugar lactone lactonase YvrE